MCILLLLLLLFDIINSNSSSQHNASDFPQSHQLVSLAGRRGSLGNVHLTRRSFSSRALVLVRWQCTGHSGQTVFRLDHVTQTCPLSAGSTGRAGHLTTRPPCPRALYAPYPAVWRPRLIDGNCLGTARERGGKGTDDV